MKLNLTPTELDWLETELTSALERAADYGEEDECKIIEGLLEKIDELAP